MRMILLFAPDFLLRPTPGHVHPIRTQQRVKERPGHVPEMVFGHQRRTVGNAHHPIGFHHRKTAAGAGAPDRLTSAERPDQQSQRRRFQSRGMHRDIYSRARYRSNREITLKSPSKLSASSIPLQLHFERYRKVVFDRCLCVSDPKRVSLWGGRTGFD